MVEANTVQHLAGTHKTWTPNMDPQYGPPSGPHYGPQYGPPSKTTNVGLDRTTFSENSRQIRKHVIGWYVDSTSTSRFLVTRLVVVVGTRKESNVIVIRIVNRLLIVNRMLFECYRLADLVAHCSGFFLALWFYHSLSQSGQAIYSLRPSTLAQWQYASQQQNSFLITKKEAILFSNKRKYVA